MFIRLCSTFFEEDKKWTEPTPGYGVLPPVISVAEKVLFLLPNLLRLLINLWIFGIAEKLHYIGMQDTSQPENVKKKEA